MLIGSHQVRKTNKKFHLKLKIWILFCTISFIVVFRIISNDYFDTMNQSNVYVDKKTVIELNYDEKTYSNIQIKTLKNKK